MVIFGIAGLGIVPPAEAVAEHGQFDTVSISKLFIAGFVPGFLIAGGLLVMNYLQCRRHGYGGSDEGWSARRVLCEMYRGFWALLAPIVILGGIYTGFFTPTEAAIVAIFYTLLIGVAVYRELTLQAINHALETTTCLPGGCC
jgi:C4-dicarboxylate transporter DctM subunit